MGEFTFVPVWVAQDILVLIATVVTVVYILKKEERPVQILLELVCFCLLDAAVYENFATLMKWYGYGRSLLMVFNVPLTVPLVEFLVIYATLRVLGTMKVPTWCKPFIVGLSGMIFDFSMDPLATMQVFATREGTIGRWSWFVGPHDVHIFTDPVYNYTGWILLCGYAAAFLLLGRYWHRKSGYNRTVGYAYPVVTMLGALAILVSPLSSFLLWLGPFFTKGSSAEWVMIAVLTAATIVLLATLWRGRMISPLSLKDELPLFLVLVGLPIIELLFTIGGRYWNVLPLEAGAAAVSAALVFGVYGLSRRRATVS
jgi:hypothetical protein